MSEQSRTTRRSVLQTCGGLCLGIVGTTTATASDTETIESAESVTRTGWYSGTVDRIVDDKYVVVLLERDGGPRDQIVVNRDRAPRVEEGSEVSLWLWRGRLFALWLD